jgi:hypothetical protein
VEASDALRWLLAAHPRVGAHANSRDARGRTPLQLLRDLDAGAEPADGGRRAARLADCAQQLLAVGATDGLPRLHPSRGAAARLPPPQALSTHASGSHGGTSLHGGTSSHALSTHALGTALRQGHPQQQPAAAAQVGADAAGSRRPANARAAHPQPAQQPTAGSSAQAALADERATRAPAAAPPARSDAASGMDTGGGASGTAVVGAVRKSRLFQQIVDIQRDRHSYDQVTASPRAARDARRDRRARPTSSALGPRSRVRVARPRASRFPVRVRLPSRLVERCAQAAPAALAEPRAQRDGRTACGQPR